MKFLFFFLFFLPLPLLAGRWEKLPGWAETVLNNTDFSKAPEDADLWRLLDETQITLQAGGTFLQERRIVQYVLHDRGASTAAVFLIDGEEDSTRITKLKGWHLKKNLALERLDKDNVLTLGLSSLKKLSRNTLTLTGFTRVGKGSVVVFRSKEIVRTFFSSNILRTMAPYPIRKRVIRVFLTKLTGKQNDVEIVPLRFKPWRLDFTATPDSLVIHDIPALGDEALKPDFSDPYPMVAIHFISKNNDSDPLASWDNLARWYHRLFTRAADLDTGREAGLPVRLQDLEETAAWIESNISYRQRYLSSTRGWTPAPGPTVERRAYGDCKDTVACFAYRGRNAGFSVYPVLANTPDGWFTRAVSRPAPNFNHLIAAVPLEQTIGFAAEVLVRDKRYLIYDPTHKYTPLGMLPAYFRDRDVMICTEEGATWVAVPETALEKQSMSITLRGLMDEHFTLNGSIELVEEGDAYFLRTLNREGNPRDLARAFRRAFSLPATLELSPFPSHIDEQRRLHIIFQVHWPSFMRRDAAGFRLPYGITQAPKRILVSQGKTRLNPIAFERQPQTRWHLEINARIPLEPGKELAEWKDAYNAFRWQASGGKLLRITYVRERQNGFFAKEQIEEGLAYWETYRSHFNKFWYQGTLFYPEPSHTN